MENVAHTFVRRNCSVSRIRKRPQGRDELEGCSNGSAARSTCALLQRTWVQVPVPIAAGDPITSKGTFTYVHIPPLTYTNIYIIKKINLLKCFKKTYLE